MDIEITLLRQFLTVVFGLTLMQAVSWGGSGTPKSPEPPYVEVPEPFGDRFVQVRQACGKQTWPQSIVLRACPDVNAVSKQLLTDPAVITREKNVAVGLAGFTDKTWPGARARWNWSHVIADATSAGAEMPPSRETKLVNSLPEEQRDDPDFVTQFLKKAREEYRSQHAQRLGGTIRLTICMAPNSQAAYEYLMRESCINSLPIDSVIGRFSESHHLSGIGTMGFGVPSSAPGHVMFVRDNIAVFIEARGDLASESLALAKKIDAMIQKQPVLTKEQLQSLRPVVTIGASGRKLPVVTGPRSRRKTNRGGHLVDYSVSVPGQEIASLNTFLIGANGKERTEIVDGKIRVVAPGNVARIRVEVITTGLLATAVERDVTLPNDPVPNTSEGNSR